jgi:Mrp family chromosome partitioning ATPase
VTGFAALVRGLIAFSTAALLVLVVPALRASSTAVELELKSPPGAIFPLDLARQLRETALDRATLERLAAERATGGNDADRIQAAAQIEGSVDVVTTDGRVFHVVVEDDDGERATRTSRELAVLVARRAPEIVARLCPNAGCAATARIASEAAPLDLPFESERLLALGFGALFALAVAFVPLTLRSPRVRFDESDEPVPSTERLPARREATVTREPARQNQALGTTIPLEERRAPERRPGSEPPRPGSEPPRPGSEPPRPGSEPPRPGSEPPRPGSAPPRPGSEPPRPGSEPPRPRSEPLPSDPNAASPIMGYPASSFRTDRVRPGIRQELAAELRARFQEQCLVVAVSATPRRGELKCATAVELALALASGGDLRVLLAEADFRNPGVAQLLGIIVPESADFPRELSRRAQGSRGTPLNVLICSDTLHVLPALPSMASELLLTTDFEASLTMIRDFYDLTVLHAPLTTGEVYCKAIADVVDGVVVISEEGGAIPEPFQRCSFLKVIPA